jgi:hypothetical protein
MISERDANLGIQGRVPLREGSILVTKTPGKTPEMVFVERVLEGRGAEMINLRDGRPFSTSLSSLERGRVGRSEVVGEFSRGKGVENTSDSKLDSDMVVVKPKGSDEEIFTIVTGIESGHAILSTPERPNSQMFRIPTQDLKEGRSEAFDFEPVPSKFSLLKDAHTLNAPNVSPPIEERAIAVCSYGVPSRDVDTGAIIGDCLPERSIEDIAKDPNAVFLEGMKMAAVWMAEEGNGRGLVALAALSVGTLAGLPILNRGIDS